MGEGITVSCASCTYKKTFMLGVGMMWGSLENVLNEITSGSSKAKISNILKHHKVNKETFSLKLYRCESCNNLYERLFVKLDYDDNREYKTEFFCDKCEKPLVIVKNEKAIILLPCPNCKNKALKFETDMLWD